MLLGFAVHVAVCMVKICVPCLPHKPLSLAKGVIQCDAMIQCHDSLVEDIHFVGKDRWVKLIGLWDSGGGRL